jgi:hypothetical protein
VMRVSLLLLVLGTCLTGCGDSLGVEVGDA